MNLRVTGMSAILATFCVSATAAPFSDFVIFGGPLEDTGNLASVVGDLQPPFYNNRFSDGPLAVDLIAEHLGVEIKPSLHRIGPVQGNNFSSVDAFASGDEPQDLPGQVEAYLASRNYVADPDALYYIIIGGNEVIEATLESDDSISREIIAGAVRAKRHAIFRLVRAGARTILAPDFIDVSITPQIRLAGLAERGKRMSSIHNRMFAKMLDGVERRLHFHLIRFSFEDFANDTLRNAEILQFTNASDSCLDLLQSGLCDFEHFIFFNDLFPTASVHKLWGYDLLMTIVHDLGRSKHDRE